MSVKELSEKHKYTLWLIGTLLMILISLVLFASIIIYVDPLFHYHPPLEKFSYPLYNEEYQNDGISRNFSYDSIIAGTSMVANFKTSEANQIFDADFIKISYSGGFYKTVNDNLIRAYDSGKEIKYVIRSLDYSTLIKDKDSQWSNVDYPAYLYNDNLFDDVNYVLNKSIMLEHVRRVIQCDTPGDFDTFGNWNSKFTFGAPSVLATYTLSEKSPVRQTLTEDERRMLLENVQENVTSIADEHPETTFYLFFTPYSICYWDVLQNEGKVDWQIDAEQTAIQEILKHPNIKLYSFSNNFELTCNLDNYKDRAHYGEWVNSWILQWMEEETYLLTEENYQEYCETIRSFYNNYDYASLHQ